MQANFQPYRPEVELAALYRRLETVSSLIRSLHRYQSEQTRPMQGCSRRTSPAA